MGERREFVAGPRVVLSEHVEVVDKEYRYRGEARHRQSRVKKYAACCLDCGANTIATTAPAVRRWRDQHACATTASGSRDGER